MYSGAWAQVHLPLTRRAGDVRLLAGLRADGGTLVNGTYLSPQLGLAVGRGRLSGEIRWSRAFNPPTLADLYFQDGVQVEPNPDLGPEQVRGEWSAAFRASDLAVGSLRADLDLQLYRADITGMILWWPDFRFVWRPDNFDVRRSGGELRARLAPVHRRFMLSAALALTDVTYAGPVLQGQVIYRPRWSAVANAQVRVLGTDAGVAWRYVGTRRTSPGTTLNALPPLHLLDLRASRFMPLGSLGFEARAVLENVLGTRTGMLPDFPFPGRMFRLSLAIHHSPQESAR